MIPQDAELTRRHDEIPAWDEMDERLKPVSRARWRYYAGFLEYADHHIGRADRRHRRTWASSTTR